mmetsp:Transcript_44083/g.87029  ORF Transcript_44083/g.87029 Transcript_44083/m.87029 type:complete len:139 (+) Transcript_44083:75-491(+)
MSTATYASAQNKVRFHILWLGKDCLYEFVCGVFTGIQLSPSFLEPVAALVITLLHVFDFHQRDPLWRQNNDVSKTSRPGIEEDEGAWLPTLKARLDKGFQLGEVLSDRRILDLLAFAGRFQTVAKTTKIGGQPTGLNN